MTPLVGWETYLERLGPAGIRLSIALLLDDAASRELIGDDGGGLDRLQRGQLLLDRADEDPSLRPQLLTLLDAACGAEPESDVSAWDEARIHDELASMLRQPETAAVAVLHRLARLPRAPLPAAELRATAELIGPELLGEDERSRPKHLAKVASARSELREVERDRRELEARVRQLETQLGRALERTGTLETRLGNRIEEIRTLRGELRAQKEERGRHEREAGRLKKRVDDLLERRARERTGEITTALRKLTAEQRRTASLLDRLHCADAERREILREQVRRIDRMTKTVEQVVSLEEAQARTSARAQQEILREFAELRSGLVRAEEGGRPARRPRGDEAADAPRVGLFVDVQNMFYAAREKNARLDFEALLELVGNSRQVVRAVAYLVETKEIDQSGFIHLLQMKAFEVKRKPLRIRSDRTAKGNWDLEMALDALSTADTLDVVVLATGDGDFVPLVRELKLQGKRVEVVGFTPSTAPDLREAADKFIAVTKRLLRPLGGPRRRRTPQSS